MNAGTLADAAVRGLIARQVARFQRLAQRCGLLEEQAQAFAGDGVHRAGGVAHQRHAAARSTAAKRREAETPPRSQVSAALAQAGGGYLGKARQRLSSRRLRIARDQHHADLARRPPG